MGIPARILTLHKVWSPVTEERLIADWVKVRTTRARIIYIRNDYKSVMDKIATALQSHFAENVQNQSNGGTAATVPSTSATTTPSTDTDDIPFAKVNSVVSGSPADSAGLKAGDQVIRFGFVTWLNHDDLRKVSEVVSQNEGVSFRIQDRIGSAMLTTYNRDLSLSHY